MTDDIDERLADVPRIQLNAIIWAIQTTSQRLDLSKLTPEKLERLKKRQRFVNALKNLQDRIDTCLIKMDQYERAGQIAYKRKDVAKALKFAKGHKYWRLKLIKERTKLALIYLKRQREYRQALQAFENSRLVKCEFCSDRFRKSELSEHEIHAHIEQLKERFKKQLSKLGFE